MKLSDLILSIFYFYFMHVLFYLYFILSILFYLHFTLFDLYFIFFYIRGTESVEFGLPYP